MSEFKGTPGPWMVGSWGGRCTKASHAGGKHPGKAGDDPCIYDLEFTAGSYGIGAQNGKMVVDIKYDELAMSTEDANLIAAAPDLLNVADLVIRRIETCLADECDMGSGTMNRIMDEARAAIARAKGEK